MAESKVLVYVLSRGNVEEVPLWLSGLARRVKAGEELEAREKGFLRELCRAAAERDGIRDRVKALVKLGFFCIKAGTEQAVAVLEGMRQLLAVLKETAEEEPERLRKLFSASP